MGRLSTTECTYLPTYLNCFYHLLWFYFLTVSEFSCLAKSFSVLA